MVYEAALAEADKMTCMWQSQLVIRALSDRAVTSSAPSETSLHASQTLG